MDAPKPIPDRLYFRIGDVAELIGVKPYVLRYWESEFPIISPEKSSTGQRVYRRVDVETVMLIRHLLYEERYSIEGARKKLRELRREGGLKTLRQEVAQTALAVPPPEPPPGLTEPPGPTEHPAGASASDSSRTAAAAAESAAAESAAAESAAVEEGSFTELRLDLSRLQVPEDKTPDHPSLLEAAHSAEHPSQTAARSRLPRIRELTGELQRLGQRPIAEFFPD